MSDCTEGLCDGWGLGYEEGYDAGFKDGEYSTRKEQMRIAKQLDFERQVLIRIGQKLPDNSAYSWCAGNLEKIINRIVLLALYGGEI